MPICGLVQTFHKRGSGVKRLVLISFFRAEAERRLAEAGNRHVVYAIEEPETSQHPEHQRGLTAALKALATAEATQVMLTTHSPEIVKHLSFDCLRLVSHRPEERVSRVVPNELPYPSLNEVTFAAFGEATSEYHDELYAHIESSGDLPAFRATRPLVNYVRLHRNGSTVAEQISSTDFIRHQIHHPENLHNPRFSSAVTLPRFHVHQIVVTFLMNGGRNGQEGSGTEPAVHGGV